MVLFKTKNPFTILSCVGGDLCYIRARRIVGSR